MNLTPAQKQSILDRLGHFAVEDFMDPEVFPEPDEQAKLAVARFVTSLSETPPAPRTSSREDAYVVPWADTPVGLAGAPLPDRVRGAPQLVCAMALHAPGAPLRSREQGREDLLDGAQLIQGSLEGMKELVCRQLDHFWRICVR